MDHQSAIHSRWRAELPRSLRYAEIASRLNHQYRIRPLVGAVLGIIGFIGGGVALVTMASLLALAV